MNEEDRRKKKKEQQKKQDEEDMKYLEEQSKENIVEYSSERKSFNFVFALFTTLLPACVLNMTLTPLNIGVYVITSLFAAYILSISYQNNFFKVRGRLAIRFEKTLDETSTKLSTNQRDFVKNEKIRLTDLASSGQALALSNFIYILSVLAFTFYFFKNVLPQVNYPLSCSLAAGLSYLLSTSTKRKDKKKK